MPTDPETNTFLELRAAVDSAFGIFEDLHEWLQDLNSDRAKITDFMSTQEQKTVEQLLKEWQPHQDSQNHWLLKVRRLLHRSQFQRQAYFLVELQKFYGEALYLGNIDFNSCVELLQKLQAFKEGVTGFEEGLGVNLTNTLNILSKEHDCFKKTEEILELDHEDADDILEDLETWEEELEPFFKTLKIKIFSVAVWWISKEGRDKGWHPGHISTGNELWNAYNRPERLRGKISKIQELGDVMLELHYWEDQFNGSLQQAQTMDAALGDKVKRARYLAQVLDPSTQLNGGNCLGDTDYWLAHCSVSTLGNQRKPTFSGFEELHESSISTEVRMAQNRQGIVSISLRRTAQGSESDKSQYEAEVELDKNQYQEIAVLEEQPFSTLVTNMFARIQDAMALQGEKNLRLRVSVEGEESAHQLGFFVDAKTKLVAFHDSNRGVFSTNELSELEKIVQLNCRLGDYENLFQQIKVYREVDVAIVPNPDKQARLKIKAYFQTSVLLRDECFEQLKQAHNSLQTPSLTDEIFFIFVMCLHLSHAEYYKDKALVTKFYHEMLEKTSRCLLQSREKVLGLMMVIRYSFGALLIGQGNSEGYVEMQQAVRLGIEWMQNKPELSDALKTLQRWSDTTDTEKMKWKQLDDCLSKQCGKLLGREFCEVSEALRDLSYDRSFADSKAFLEALERIEQGVKPVFNQFGAKESKPSSTDACKTGLEIILDAKSGM